MRAGVESEILPGRAAWRVGGYFEPSRFADSEGRVHATAGGDLRVGLWWDWRLSVVVDAAPGRLNAACGFGLWH